MKLFAAIILLALLLVPSAQAGTLLIQTKLCLDTSWPQIGTCQNPSGNVGGVTVTGSGILGSTTTDGGGYGSLAINAQGTGYLNLTKSGYRSDGPTYTYFSSSSDYNGSNLPPQVTFYVYLQPVLCSPGDQSITVPAAALWSYTVQATGTQGFYTILKADPSTATLIPVYSTGPLLNSYGSIRFPLGGFATHNGTSGQLDNSTGSFVLVITNGVSVITSCTLEIQTTGTNFQPLSLTDTQNASILQSISNQVLNIKQAQAAPPIAGVDFMSVALSVAIGRSWFFPNFYYWVAAAIIIARFIHPRRQTGEDAL